MFERDAPLGADPEREVLRALAGLLPAELSALVRMMAASGLSPRQSHATERNLWRVRRVSEVVGWYNY